MASVDHKMTKRKADDMLAALKRWSSTNDDAALYYRLVKSVLEREQRQEVQPERMQKQKQRHQHHHQQQQAPQKPRGSRGALREFSLAQWTDADCRDLFWFSKDEIIAIVDALELPERVAATGVTCTPLEAVCVFLRRMAHRDRLQDMAPLFDRASSVLCNVYLHMVAFVCEKNGMDPNHSDTKRLGRTLREQGPEQSKLKNYPHMLTHGGNKRPRH